MGKVKTSSDSSKKSSKKSKTVKKGSPSRAEAEIALNDFLDGYKVSGQGIKYTHSGFGGPWGKWDIPDNALEEFIQIYTSAFTAGVPVHIIEKPKDVAPFVIDIDYKFSEDNSDRQYTEDDVKYMISCANGILKEYYLNKNGLFNAFLFEKPAPTYQEKSKEYKDGCHIMYPNLAMSKAMRFLVTKRFREKIEEDNGFDHIPFTNALDDVIDTSVVKTNGWTMYGSKKHMGPLYTLQKIYNSKLEPINTSSYENTDLPRLLCVRKFSDRDEIKFKKSVEKVKLQKLLNQMELEMVPKKDRKTKVNFSDAVKSVKNRKKKEASDEDYDSDSIESEDEEEYDGKRKKISNKGDVQMARKLLKLLDKKRADSYHDWIQVGWALHNISHGLLNDWIEFSEQSVKYSSEAENSCRREWNNARSDGLTIASLAMWARIDDPEGFIKLQRESVNKLIMEAESGTECDIAKVVHALWQHEFRCSSIEKGTWYFFRDHRWRRIERGHVLRRRISEELTKEFSFLASYYFQESCTKEGMEADGCRKKADGVSKIIRNLKKNNFKKAIMEECLDLFYDEKFEENLDSNPDLIGFENGIYDLEEGRFRPGTPDDNMSFSTGYDYVEYSLGHKDVREVMKYFDQVQIEGDMRQYVLTLLSSYLDGHIKAQKFIIWTGSGANSKSTTVDFFKNAIGDYYGVMPVTVLTRKQAGAGNATPELADKRGKRFVVIQEPEADDHINVGHMKYLTGGDTINSRQLYEKAFEYKPQFKLILTCNKLPHIPSNDNGTWRRLRVTPWESEFLDHDQKIVHPKRQFYKDYEITDKILRLAPALMWYLLKHVYPDYRKNGIREPPKVTKFTKKYRQDSDIYLEFISEQLVITKNPKDKEDLSVIYSILRDWYRESYTSQGCPSKKNMIEYLEKNDYKVSGTKLRCVKFKDDVEDDDDDEEAGGDLESQLTELES